MIFKPHPYQREAIRRLEERGHYGLFLDMGLGKTVITLTAIENLIYDRCEVSRVLIIAPKKVAEATWQNEAKKWEHLRGLRFSTIIGTAGERSIAASREADCYVINRDNVVWLCEHFKFMLPFDMVVIDESTSFKNPASKRFKALRKCLGEFSRVIILTGTPAPNTFMDLWSQIYLLDEGRALGRTITQYRDEYFKPDRRNGHIVYSWKLRSEESGRAITEAIAPVCMSLKSEDYINLPPRIDNVITLSMEKSAREKYDSLMKNLTLFDGKLTVANAAALSNKLLQMANGCVYTDDSHVKWLHSEKLAAISDIVEQNEGKPILVFYAFKHDLARLRAIFTEARVLDSARTVEEWNEGKISMLLAHPASCAYGINLQAGGNVIVWYGLTWSLELYEQANARLYRQGQSEPVIVHHLVMDETIDVHVMRALKAKKAGQEELLAAVREIIKKG